MSRVAVAGVFAAALAAAAAVPASGSSAVRCPVALPLGSDPIAPAARAALARESKSTRPQVTSATLARHDHDRGPQAQHDCGARVRARTVVVYITLRKFLPSASLSERVDFVARTRAGWRVWEVVH